MTRAQRRAAGTLRLEQGVAAITEQGQGLCGLAFIAPGQLPELMVQGFLGDDQCFAIARALVATATNIRDADPPVLCLVCPAEIRDAAWVGLYALVRAEVDKPELALASAICSACCERHDLTDRVHEMYRKIWPEFRPLIVSAGTGAVQ
jgi:hypothetical protein